MPHIMPPSSRNQSFCMRSCLYESKGKAVLKLSLPMLFIVMAALAVSLTRVWHGRRKDRATVEVVSCRCGSWGKKRSMVLKLQESPYFYEIFQLLTNHLPHLHSQLKGASTEHRITRKAFGHFTRFFFTLTGIVGHLFQNSTTRIIIFNKIYLHSTTLSCSTSIFPLYILHLYLFNFTEIYLYSKLHLFSYWALTHNLLCCYAICIPLLPPYFASRFERIHSYSTSRNFIGIQQLLKFPEILKCSFNENSLAPLPQYRFDLTFFLLSTDFGLFILLVVFLRSAWILLSVVEYLRLLRTLHGSYPDPILPRNHRGFASAHALNKMASGRKEEQLITETLRECVREELQMQRRISNSTLFL